MHIHLHASNNARTHTRTHMRVRAFVLAVSSHTVPPSPMEWTCTVACQFEYRGSEGEQGLGENYVESASIRVDMSKQSSTSKIDNEHPCSSATTTDLGRPAGWKTTQNVIHRVMRQAS